MRRPTTRFAALAALTIGAATLVGCHGSGTAAEFRKNPTPVADSLSRSNDEIMNRISKTNDTNLRALNEDLGRFFLLDKPSTLRLPRNYTY